MAAFCLPQQSPVLNVTLPQESSPTTGGICGQNAPGRLAQSRRLKGPWESRASLVRLWPRRWMFPCVSPEGSEQWGGGRRPRALSPAPRRDFREYAHHWTWWTPRSYLWGEESPTVSEIPGGQSQSSCLVLGEERPSLSAHSTSPPMVVTETVTRLSPGQCYFLGWMRARILFFFSILDIVFNNCKDWSTEVCLLCFACVYVNPYTRQHLACMPNFFPKERLVTKSCIRSYILKNKKGFMWPGSHYPSWTMKSRTETVTTGVEAEWWLKKKIQRGGRAGILNLGPTGLLHKGSVHRTQEIHQTWIGENDIFISTNL